jgi:hypothetical protein
MYIRLHSVTFQKALKSTRYWLCPLLSVFSIFLRAPLLPFVYASCLHSFILYGCEICSLILETEDISEQAAEENIFTEEDWNNRKFKKKVLMRNFVICTYCDNLIAGIALWTQHFLYLCAISLHTKELRNLYSSPSIIRINKSRKMRWAGHVARMGGEEERV